MDARRWHSGGRLYPAGTRLKDVPPEARGMAWTEWLDAQIAEWKRECSRPSDVRVVRMPEAPRRDVQAYWLPGCA